MTTTFGHLSRFTKWLANRPMIKFPSKPTETDTQKFFGAKTSQNIRIKTFFLNPAKKRDGIITKNK